MPCGKKRKRHKIATHKRKKRLRKDRENGSVKIALRELKEAAQEGVNLVPPILDAVRVYATGGEIAETLREVFGEYVRPSY